MKYETQKIAFWYFSAAMLLFALQVTFGVLAGYIYVSAPDTTRGSVPRSAMSAGN